jgi:hypothetical protein
MFIGARLALRLPLGFSNISPLLAPRIPDSLAYAGGAQCCADLRRPEPFSVQP